MYYTLICLDKENCSQLRKKQRPFHLNFLEGYKKKILFAGPLLDEKNNVKGSLIVISAAKKSDVEKFYKNDPYFLSGLFSEVKVYKFKKVF